MNARLKNHLGAWIPEFASKVEANAQTEFYKDIARTTKNLIENGISNLVV